MDTNTVSLHQNVSLEIFDDPLIAKQVKMIFDTESDAILKQIKEISEVRKSHLLPTPNAEKIVYYLKQCFFVSVMNEAIELSFKGNFNYNLFDNVLSLLNVEKLKFDIESNNIMLAAFWEATNSIRTSTCLADF